MFKHVVMWQLKNRNDLTARQEMIRRLKLLETEIPQLRRLEIGLDMLQLPASADILLITEFDSQQDYLVYRDHPGHRAVVNFINSVTSERRVVDYEI
jgi:hypothetical protein